MFKFNNTYNQLPASFFSKTQAQKFHQPNIIAFNHELARELGADCEELSKDELALIFSGQVEIKNSAQIAMAYAGHQFGHFNPRLGDGRAQLLGEIITPLNKRFDIQLKGAGPTPYSRGGDGKSSLGPVVREYILSEAMYKLGVKTTRALAMVSTGEHVYRDTPQAGGVFTRVASSHIRIGTFEFFAGQGDFDSVGTLLDYTIDRHYPEIDKNNPSKVIQFIKSYANKQAQLVAKWMSLGFIHGVMNTDNMAISGETIDYGPCAFIDQFQANKVYSFIDKNGRYAYNNQLTIARWNLYRLASTLGPLISDDQDKAVQILESALDSIESVYANAYLSAMLGKFGLTQIHSGDKQLIDLWLNYLEEESLDFTNSYRELSKGDKNLISTPALQDFLQRLSARKTLEKKTTEQSIEIMNSNNPIYIPRNHLVEEGIQAAFKSDYTKFESLYKVLQTPYTDQANTERYKTPPQEHEVVKNTFCGT